MKSANLIAEGRKKRKKRTCGEESYEETDEDENRPNDEKCGDNDFVNEKYRESGTSVNLTAEGRKRRRKRAYGEEPDEKTIEDEDRPDDRKRGDNYFTNEIQEKHRTSEHKLKDTLNLIKYVEKEIQRLANKISKIEFRLEYETNEKTIAYLRARENLLRVEKDKLTDMYTANFSNTTNRVSADDVFNDPVAIENYFRANRLIPEKISAAKLVRFSW